MTTILHPGIESECTDAEHEAGAECLKAALDYAERGWSVSAVCPPDHQGVGKKHSDACDSPGKAPWGAWKEFQDRAPTADELRKKWRDNPFLNVGIFLGPVSGLVRLDIDGLAGEKKLAEICGGQLPPTLEFASPGGRGLLFRIPPGAKIKTTGIKAEGIHAEVRFQARGAQTVLPPSRGSNGKCWTWKPGHGPDEIEPAYLPDHLVAIMAEKPVHPRQTRAWTEPSNSRSSAYGRVALEKECQQISTTIEGGRNDQLFKSAASIFELVAGNVIDEADAIGALTDAALACGLHEGEIKNTIESARRRGIKNPRGVPHRESPNGNEHHHNEVPPLDGGERDHAMHAKEKSDGPSNEAADDQDRLARHYLTRCNNEAGEQTLIYWLDDWYQHDGAAYAVKTEPVIQSEIYRAVKFEFDRINKQEMDTWHAADPSNRKSQQPKTIKIPRGLIGNIELALRSKTLISPTVKPPVWLDTGQSGSLLAVQNGLLDLDAFASGSTVLISNTAKWFTTTKVPYSFVADAECPRWNAFLQKNFEGDADRIAILQEWFGLNLKFDTSFHKFLLLEGEGGNGKGVVCAALQAMLGEGNYSSVSLELFGERFQLAPTLGKLANIVPDLGEIDRVAEGFLKGFVSGDPMHFDRKNKPPINCPATARITIAMNMRPRFNDRSSGLWRRMILMPMRVVIPESEKILKMDKPEAWVNERPGLLNWALGGLRRLIRQRRFTTAELCEEALREYKLESNPAKIFLDDLCRECAEVEGGVVCKRLYEAYQAWAIAHGYKPLSNGKFGAEVKRAYPKMRRTQVCRDWTYLGVQYFPAH